MNIKHARYLKSHHSRGVTLYDLFQIIKGIQKHASIWLFFYHLFYFIIFLRNYHFTKESFSKATCIHSYAIQKPCSFINETLKIIKNNHALIPSNLFISTRSLQHQSCPDTLQSIYSYKISSTPINNHYFMPIKYSRPTLHSQYYKFSLRSELYVEL